MPVTRDPETIPGVEMEVVARRPSPYVSSHPLEELDVRLTDGTTRELVMKKGDVLTDGARGAKPAFLLDPLRELQVYRRLLEPTGISAPALFGADGATLYLERVRGSSLTEVGEFAVWEHVARSLAGWHELLAGRSASRLIRYDPAFYGCWLKRAQAFTRVELGSIEAAHAAGVAELLDAVQTPIHGELYAGNIIVAGDRVVPLDWETAAFGPACVDVAALTSGRWTDAERRALALAYRSALAAPPPEERFLRELECARLHLAVQWLGWSESWSPPPGQAQDWLAEARRAAQRIA